MFVNRTINGIYESRFIASWLNAGGELRNGSDYDDFREWLSSLGLTNDQVNHLVYLAMNGKLELEEHAKKFLSKHK